MQSLQHIVRRNAEAQARHDETHPSNQPAEVFSGSFQIRDGIIVPVGDALLAAIEPVNQ
jgi:hypothetical protein